MGSLLSLRAGVVAASVAFLAVVMGLGACSSGAKTSMPCGAAHTDCPGADASSGPTFPYKGPSCTGGSFSGSCYGCAENSCGGTLGCLDGDCASYFTCFCACASGDATCQAGCAFSSACRTCVQSITACEQKACNPVCMTGTPETTCSETGQTCTNGSTLEACSVSLGGLCQTQYYTVGAQSFPCAACGDCSAAGTMASAACQ